MRRRRTRGTLDRRAPETASGVDALIVDRWPRVGDNWRKRYHALTLHNQVHVNHLPLHAVPAELAGLHPEGQARRTGSRPTPRRWSSTTDRRPSSRAAATTKAEQRWSVALRRADGTDARRCIRGTSSLATGVSGIPNMPDIPDAAKTSGARSCTPASTSDGEAWKRQARARHRHRQQRPRHRAGPALERRAGHAGAAQPDADRQHRARARSCLRALRAKGRRSRTAT